MYLYTFRLEEKEMPVSKNDSNEMAWTTKSFSKIIFVGPLLPELTRKMTLVVGFGLSSKSGIVVS